MTFTLEQQNINKIGQIEIEKSICLFSYIYIHSQSLMNVTHSSGWLFYFIYFFKTERRCKIMNKFELERKFAERMKRCYPPGTRLVLLSMDDPMLRYRAVQKAQLSTLTMPHKSICDGITAELLPLSPVKIHSEN